MNDILYKEHILELYRNPVNKRVIEGATHIEKIHNPFCGDDMTIYLDVQEGLVHDASFMGAGCAISIAAASLLTEQVKGKTIEYARQLLGKDIVELLGIPIGPVREKCATLCLRGIQQALHHGVQGHE